MEWFISNIIDICDNFIILSYYSLSLTTEHIYIKYFKIISFFPFHNSHTSLKLKGLVGASLQSTSCDSCSTKDIVKDFIWGDNIQNKKYVAYSTLLYYIKTAKR